MITRGEISHQYYPIYKGRVVGDGAVRVNVVNNIPQTWAIARPTSYPDPNGAPYYCHKDSTGGLLRGGSTPLIPPWPHREMDPSDQTSWQRPYSFSI